MFKDLINKIKYGRHLNLMQSPYDPEQWKFKDALPLGAFQIPENYESKDLGFSFDQKQSSMCAASAYSYLRMLQESDSEQSELTEAFCPTWTYGMRIDGAYCGEGMYISDVVKGGRIFGSVLNGELEYPCTYKKAKKLAADNKDSLMKKAEPFQTTSYYACNSRREIQVAIMETGGVLIGIPVFKNFYTPIDGKVEFVSGLHSDGGHCVCIVGWKTINGKLYWKLKNSWGSSWGVDGYCWLSEEYPWMDSAYVVVDEKTEIKFKDYVSRD